MNDTSHCSGCRDSRSWVALLLVGLMACVGKVDDPGGGGGGEDTMDAAVASQPDAAPIPNTPDAAPLPPPDAAPPPPDAPPAVTYPPGPYGNSEGDVIKALSWSGYVDSDADTDNDPFNEPVTTVSLEDFYQGFDPGARIILINASAGWCSVCQDEAQSLRNINTEYFSRGGRIITALFQDTNGYAADTDFAKTWGEYFELTSAVVADPNDLLSPYYLEDTVPLNIFVDASNMVIVEVHHGFDDSTTRQIFESYVD